MSSLVYTTLAIAVFVLSASATYSATEKATSGRLEALIAKGLQDNRSLRRTRKQADAEAAKTSTVGAYKDPVLSYTKSNYPTDSFRADRQAMTGDEIKLVQEFSFPGRLGRLERAAEHRASAAGFAYQQARLDLVAAIKSSYYDLYAQQGIERLLAEELRSKKKNEEFAFAKYRTGKGILQDVTRAQLEVAIIRTRILETTNKVEALAARLNELTDRSQSTKIGAISTIALPQIRFAELNLDALVRGDLQKNPALLAARMKAKADRSRLRSANLGYGPDFVVGVSYRIREKTPMSDGQDFMSASIGVRLPIYGAIKQSAAEDHAGKRLEASLEDQHSVFSALTRRLKTGIDRGRLQEKLIDLYQADLLPAADKALASARSAYKVNKIGFASVISTEKALFRYRREHIIARASLAKAAAEIESILGALPQLPRKTK